MQAISHVDRQAGFELEETMNCLKEANVCMCQVRRLVCLLGLPIDVIDLQTAVGKVFRAASTGERCVISTPNLNFLMAAQTDVAFRESVLRSDLVLADGVSLLMLARLMGVPLPERVSGADLFQALCESKPATPLKVFFLGGPHGAAALACEQVNKKATGVRCVGFDEGGFGNVESLSSQSLIDQINASAADFVVVSFGAKKGQSWIMRNHDRLTAPLVCHLGAVVNFTAGTVPRAPKWMQSHGLEWLWRAMTEPGLFKRYWDDGRDLLKILAGRGVHAAIFERYNAWVQHDAAKVDSHVIRGDGVRHIRLSGGWGADDADSLRGILSQHNTRNVVIDGEGVTWMHPYVMGALAGHHGELLNRGGSLRLDRFKASVERQIWRDGVGYLIETPALLKA